MRGSCCGYRMTRGLTAPAARACVSITLMKSVTAPASVEKIPACISGLSFLDTTCQHPLAVVPQTPQKTTDHINTDLARAVQRHKNHFAIFMWSLSNPKSSFVMANG